MKFTINKGPKIGNLLNPNDYPKGFYKFPPYAVGIDTECTGLRWSQDDRLFTLAVVFDWHKAKRYKLYTSFPVDGKTRIPDYNNQKGLNIFNNWIWRNPNIKKVLANAKYDWHMIESSFGPVFEPVGEIHDVLLAGWCCNTLEKSYKLESLAYKYLRRPRNDAKRLRDATIALRKRASSDGLRAGRGISVVAEDYWLLQHYGYEELLKEYNVNDAEDALDLWYFFEEGMKPENLDVRETYDREIEVLQILYQMEAAGIRFNEQKALEKIDEINNENCQLYVDLQMQANTYLGKIINLNSPKQLQELFYSKQGFSLPVIRRTKGGEPSTDAKTLVNYIASENLAGDKKEFIDKFLHWKGNNKGKDFCRDYIDKAAKDELIKVNDLPFLHQRKAIHTSFNQLYSDADRENKTRTGRLSSSGPNVHNVAKPETSGGYHVVDGREFFIPREGYCFYFVDYKQIELRIFAYRLGQINKNNALYQAFLKDEDPHEAQAQSIPFLKNMEDRKYARQLGKHSNFTVANCGGANALWKQYGVPLLEGEQLIKGFYEANPEAKIRQRQAERFGIEHGYIETITGRKININKERDKHGYYKYTYRATSYDIQGSAADIIKMAMLNWTAWKNCHPELKKKDARILLQVHDELVFEIWKKDTHKWFLRETVKIMEDAAKPYIDYPIKCSIEKSTESWSENTKQKVIL